MWATREAAQLPESPPSPLLRRAGGRAGYPSAHARRFRAPSAHTPSLLLRNKPSVYAQRWQRHHMRGNSVGVTQMPKYQQPKDHIPTSIETAWRDGGESEALEAIIIKYAKVLHMTDSGRDIKPLATGMLETIDRLKALQAAEGASKDAETPLANVFRLAESA